MSCNLEIKYNDERWATIITQAEEDCIEYIKTNHSSINGDIALDIGIGASKFFIDLQDSFTRIDGLTVIDKEILIGQNLAKNTKSKYRIIKENKYNVLALNSILDHTYPVIVDVNLKMFACCQRHWKDYLFCILNKIKKGGILLTHTVGFGGYKNEIFKSDLTMEELEDLLSLSDRKISIKMIESSLIQGHSLVVFRAKN